MIKRLATLTGAAIATASLFAAVAGALPTPTATKIITASDLDSTSASPAVVATDGQNKWFMYNDTNDTVDNTLGNFVYGPAAPPHGVGSVQFTLAASPMDRKNIATFQFSGQALAGITKLGYAAYSHSGVAGANESPYLNFNVDFTGTSGTFQKRLVYVPSANMATVPQDTWNTYDAINSGNALWTWSGFAKGPDNTAGTADDNTWPGGNTNQYRTWNSILAAFPNARLLPTGGWLGVRVGEPGPTGYTGNVDSLTFGTASKVTTYDFEPTNQPTKNKDCKNDGWKSFNAPTFASEKACKNWVEARAHGTLHMSNPSQKIRIHVANTGDGQRSDEENDNNKNTIEYWNFDYPENGGSLHYKTETICQNVNPITNDARILFQIPEGHPGLSGLYIVIYVKNNHHNVADIYSQEVAPDLATGTQWCQTGVGFAPTSYTVTKSNLEIDD